MKPKHIVNEKFSDGSVFDSLVFSLRKHGFILQKRFLEFGQNGYLVSVLCSGL